jgi:hypothetical protein
MPRHGKPQHQSHVMPQSKDIGPVTREELAFAVDLTDAATSHQMPMRSPADFRLLLEDDGEVQEVQFADAPINRAVLALAEHFKGDSQQYYRVSFRMFALWRIMRSKEVQTRLQSKDRVAVFGAIVEVAAAFPLSPGIRFRKEPFLQRVDEVIRARGATASG